MLNCYAKFLPNISSRLAPLNKSFAEGSRVAKNALTSAEVLVHYDPTKQLRILCDASPYGVGAVLSHQLDDGTEHPHCFCLSLTGTSREEICPIG